MKLFGVLLTPGAAMTLAVLAFLGVFAFCYLAGEGHDA